MLETDSISYFYVSFAFTKLVFDKTLLLRILQNNIAVIINTIYFEGPIPVVNIH